MPAIGYFIATLFAEKIIAYDHWIAFALLCFLGVKMIMECLKDGQAPDTKSYAETSGTDEHPIETNGDVENTDQVHDNSACCDEQQPNIDETSINPSKMLPLALATSIDALAVGVSFAFLQIKILPAVTFIGVTTLTISMLGVKIGNIFGAKFKTKAELAGGIILVLIGLKILLEHLNIIHL
jgi:putative Mn2+ efflux pump MntP